MTEITEDYSEKTEDYTLFKTFPINSAIPAICTDHNGRKRASLIIVADNDMIEHFRENSGNMLDIQVTTYLRNDHNSKRCDLIMRLDFFSRKTHATYEAVLDGGMDSQQYDFASVLRDSEDIDIWITDTNEKIQRIIPVKWNFSNAVKNLDEIIQYH